MDYVLGGWLVPNLSSFWDVVLLMLGSALGGSEAIMSC